MDRQDVTKVDVINIPLIKGVIVLVLAILIMIISLFSNIAAVVFNDEHYIDQFDQLNRPRATGMTEQELMRVTGEIQNYFRLEHDDIDITAEIEGEQQQLFTERELIHMDDVKELFISGYQLLGAALLIITLGLIYLWRMLRKEKEGIPLLLTVAINATVTACLLIALGASVFYTGFDYWYDALHHLLFDNPYWMLNPSEHHLISIYPEQFFQNTAFLILRRTIVQLVMIGLTIGAVKYAYLKRAA